MIPPAPAPANAPAPTLTVTVSPFRLRYLIRESLINVDTLDEEAVFRRLGLLLEALGMAPARDPQAPFLLEPASSYLTLKEQPFETLFARPWRLTARQSAERGRLLWQRWRERLPAGLLTPGSPQETEQRLNDALREPLLQCGLFALWIPAVAALVQGLILLTAKEIMV